MDIFNRLTGSLTGTGPLPQNNNLEAKAAAEAAAKAAAEAAAKAAAEAAAKAAAEAAAKAAAEAAAEAEAKAAAEAIAKLNPTATAEPKEGDSLVETAKGYLDTTKTVTGQITTAEKTLMDFKANGGAILNAAKPLEKVVDGATSKLRALSALQGFNYLKGADGAIGTGSSIIGLGLNVASLASGNFSDFSAKDFADNVVGTGEGLKTLGEVATKYSAQLTKAVGVIEKVVPPAQIIAGTVGLAIEGKEIYDNITEGDYKTNEGKWDLAKHGAGAVASACTLAAGVCAMTGVGAPVAAVLAGVAAGAGVVQMAIDNRETIANVATTIGDGISNGAKAVSGFFKGVFGSVLTPLAMPRGVPALVRVY